MSKIIGIDLGSTASAVSVLENGKAKIIVNSEGERTTNSVVAYTKNGILVGKAAKNQAITNPKNTVSIIKRFIGKKYKDVIEDTKMMPYDIIDGPNGDCRVKIDGKLYSPEEISAQILIKLKKAAEDYLGETVTDAVITVPAYFGDAERQATKDAGKIAGLNVKRIINEPTSACLSLDLDKKNCNVVVADLGGATADFSILSCGDGVFEVLSTNGNPRWGGSDLDHAITQYLVDEFKKSDGIDLSKDPMALQRLNEAAEKAKIELSTLSSTDINLPYITADASGPKHLQITLTRAKFEQLIEPLFDKLKVCCSNVLKDSGLSVKDLNEVVICGGTTRVPYAQKFISEQFGSKELNKSGNLDEMVAEGAAIQAGVLAGDVKDVLLLDVVPLSLGIETMGGVFTKLIERNTTVPTSKSQVFSTAEDGQTAVTIRVLQGERQMASENKLLGSFNLDSIPVAPRGVPQIDVSFSLDANSILTVTAKDKGTGKEQHITINNSSGLSEEEINKAIKDAEVHAEEDAKLKEKVDVKNSAEAAIFGTEKSLKDYGDKMTGSEKEEIQKAIDELKAVKDGDDVGDIKSKTQKLQESSYKIAEKMYSQTQQSGSQTNNDQSDNPFSDIMNGFGANTSQTESGPNKDNKDAVDADFEVVD